MTPVGLAAVGARIAELRARFEPPPGFADQLGSATATRSSASGVASAGGASAVPLPGAASGALPLSSAATAIAAARGAARPATAGTLGAAIGTPDVAVAASGSWAARLPEAGRPWAGAIEQAATAAGVEPALLAALVQAESGFDASARSGAGAIGLGQLMPATARGLGVDPTDPQQNLNGAARYLRAQLDRFGSVDLALAAYNAGPGRVAQAGGVPRIAETQAYVRRVTASYELLRSAA